MIVHSGRVGCLVDLSDQIDAELSQEGGNICQAEGSLSVGPYNRKDISPACISRTARAETNSRAERDSRAKPRVVDTENWNDENCWRSEKKQTESTNIKILGCPLHVMHCIVVVTMLASGHDRLSRICQVKQNEQVDSKKERKR